MKTSLFNEESIAKEGPANLQRGLETVGGWLYLTNKRLIFEPHVINAQRWITVLNVVNISGMNKAWTKFLNLIPIFPNTISVHTKDSNDYNFVIFGRDSWIQAINQIRNI